VYKEQKLTNDSFEGSPGVEAEQQSSYPGPRVNTMENEDKRDRGVMGQRTLAESLNTIGFVSGRYPFFGSNGQRCILLYSKSGKESLRR
jgi:hypothetical protein